MKELSQIIKFKFTTKPKRITRDLYCYLAIYVGELLRREIVSNNKFCDPWRFVIGQLEMASFIPIDIAGIIERLEADSFFPVDNSRYKGLRPGSAGTEAF